jgi:hypothetical protein
MTLPVDTVEDYRASMANIAGALAHELNNPLQGMMSLLSVFSRECAQDEKCQVRLEQFRSGLTRLTRIVTSFSVAYENLPRDPDVTTLRHFCARLHEAMAERQLVAEFEPLPAAGSFRCMATELVRLTSDALSIAVTDSRRLRVSAAATASHIVITAAQLDAPAAAEPWRSLGPKDTVFGLAVLIREIAKLGGGDAEFHFNDMSLDGIRLFCKREDESGERKMT